MEKAARLATAQDPPSRPTPKAGLRILFAEDDAGMGWLVRRFLEGSGHSVHLVQDGRQAVEAAKREAFDVVLLDLLMPGMDGIEAAKRIRAHADGECQCFPIIAATSHQVENLDDHLDISVFDAVLSKPVKGEKLASLVASFSK